MSALNKLIEKQIEEAAKSLSVVRSGMDNDHLYQGHLVDCVTALLEVVQNQQHEIEFLNDRCDALRGRLDNERGKA